VDVVFGDLVEEMDVTISDSIDDLFEESDVMLGNLLYD
jgi:hypothetical protein